MLDPTLVDLQSWFAKGDRFALGRAYEALQREARPIVQRFEPWHRTDALQERVLEIVNGLLFPPLEQQPPGRPSKLLPAAPLQDSGAARSYRARTISNVIIDEHRTRLRQKELALAASDPITAASIREIRCRRRAQQSTAPTAQPLMPTRSDVLSSAGGLVMTEQHTLDRIAIRRTLYRLPNVRYRGILAIEFGFDLTAFLNDLAAHLGRDASELERTVAMLQVGDEEALVRIFYPLPAPIAKARENSGRARRRALSDLRSALAQEMGP